MKKCLTLLGYLFAVLLFLSYSFETQKDNFPKPFVFDYAEFDANNIRAYVTNYGSFFRHPRTGNSGFEWPTGSKKYEIYSAGLWEEEIKGKKKSQPDEIVTTSLLTLRSNLIKIEYYNFSNRVQV